MDVRAVKQVAREKLGALSRGATGEYGMLARLLRPDEPILAMAIGKLSGGWLFSTRLVVATPERILLVGKAMITRRERVQEIALADLRAVRVSPPATLELDLDGDQVRLNYLGPAPQLSALADAARGRTGSRFGELDALARRKLGRLLGFGVEQGLMGLAEALEPEEAVVDLAAFAGKPGGLVAVCEARIVVVPDRGFGSGTPVSVPFADMLEVRHEGADLFVDTSEGEHHLRDVLPPQQAGIIADRVRARLR